MPLFIYYDGMRFFIPRRTCATVFFPALFLICLYPSFALSGRFSSETKTAANGMDLLVYSLSYFEVNQVTDLTYGHKQVEFNVTLKQAVFANPEKSPVIEKINERLTGIQNPNEKKIRQKLEARLQESYAEWGDRNFIFQVEESIAAVFADTKIIMLDASFYFYKGGAHGMYGSQNQAYSLENGKNISSLSDLFTNPSSPELLLLLRHKLLENNGEKLNIDDFFEYDSIVLPENFEPAPDKSGIWFHYNLYEVLPYSYGQVSVFFTAEELVPFIKTDGPYGYLFG